jgi:hypothetical protein
MRSAKRTTAAWVIIAGTVPLYGSVLADEITWEAHGNPLRVCGAMQRNVRFMYNARANGATETYAQMKDYMRQVLSGKGEPEERLRVLYEEILARIEAGEYSPPKETPAEGQLKARSAAGASCLKAFQSD